MNIEYALLIIGLGTLGILIWFINKLVHRQDYKEPELNLKEIYKPEPEPEKTVLTIQVKREADSKDDYNQCPCTWERPDICRHCDIKNK